MCVGYGGLADVKWGRTQARRESTRRTYKTDPGTNRMGTRHEYSERDRNKFVNRLSELSSLEMNSTNSTDMDPLGGEFAGKNGTKFTEWSIECAKDAPTMQHLLKNMPVGGYGILLLYMTCMVITIAIYGEEVHFVMKKFKRPARRRATIWILAYFPVFSVTGFLGAIMPRSATLVDMVSTGFFGTCLYQFVGLMTNYMGGPKRMWDIVGTERQIQTNTPPCCCCCPCLPKATFRRKTYFKWCMLVMQVAIIRPILMFFAAVLWTNGSYMPGILSMYNGYTYIVVLNLLTTLPAMYGLYLLRNALGPDLEEKFSLMGKIASLQLTMLATAVPNLIISFCVTFGAITCTPVFPSKSAGETIYHGVLVVLMLPFALIGRKFFRRESDGFELADHPDEALEESQVQEVLTVNKDGKRALVTIKRLSEDDDTDPIEMDMDNGHGEIIVKVDADAPPEKGTASYTTSL
ncbi:hypothetical protein CAPTEDRAFT_187913 [Capitella teleta]|uniref:Uncharacterized protein n=1 Tax=Capitella teleta TaxID=283909 RepID=R7U417_CAPTE|nr:hypothetical protein CAPTEDRAFT_187913 [Capitella teleta]|eukprot:ELU01090.1 hypothetical protein CAPTEDRAFT_187913 [Capitella teleta]